MTDLPYRNDPLTNRSEAQRVADADAAFVLVGPQHTPSGAPAEGLLTHPETGHLVGIEQAPAAPSPMHQPGVRFGPTDRTRVITAEEAANRIRDKFVPAAMPPEYHHQTPFMIAVAGYLRADPNPANLEQIARLLDEAEVEFPDASYPTWVTPHASHVVDHGGKPFAVGFADQHLDRENNLTVLVENADREKFATSELEKPKDGAADKPDLHPDLAFTQERAPRVFEADPAADPAKTDDPIAWNPFNKVVQDHRDGTVDQKRTNAERKKRGLPTPWTPEIGKSEESQPPVE
jgi:hypothetical protein